MSNLLNIIKKLLYFLVINIIMVLSLLKVASAATQSANMLVEATVASTCSITPSPLAFGNYTLAQLDQSTSLLVTCTNGTGYTIGLDAGTGSGATVAIRKMTSGGNTLNYSLYQDAGRATVWGNTIGNNTVAGTGTGATQTITVYGRIPANQTSPLGNYTDTISVTIEF